MKPLLVAMINLLVVLAGLSRESRALADDPILLKAELFTHTNNEDKDHDTGINISVKPADGSGEIAYCSDAEDSSTDATQYKDGSDHTVPLTIRTPGVKKSACKGFKVHMSISTHGGAGHDTWRFNAKVILSFSDNTNLIAAIDNVELKNDGAATDFANTP